ncbi:LytR C-terminal domain-containing protein [Nocardioides anomalus]|uniref:LytR C-terminal domain-containing protein n=1 Tax=Nocardioides anomalus TaxID=2712223 RepID=A0A6G6WI90_9ACTN|nr:LytR C-terminal domain-containing protein [Nocardioides anomalus]QIG44954.1 LytR C-terminal domain-containing protein [Nocardioides anomalus]
MWWSTLTAKVRTLITLAFLLVLLLGGVTWGWAQVTEPFPGKVDAPVCVDTSYQAGAELAVQDVTVSVLNASGREGLAARTMQQLEDAGFAAGKAGNAPSGTSLTDPAEIWVTDADSPAATLVRRRVGKVPVRDDVTSPVPGVTLVVGDAFGDVKADGPDALKVKDDAVVCSPPVG